MGVPDVGDDFFQSRHFRYHQCTACMAQKALFGHADSSRATCSR